MISPASFPLLSPGLFPLFSTAKIVRIVIIGLLPLLLAPFPQPFHLGGHSVRLDVASLAFPVPSLFYTFRLLLRCLKTDVNRASVAVVAPLHTAQFLKAPL